MQENINVQSVIVYIKKQEGNKEQYRAVMI